MDGLVKAWSYSTYNAFQRCPRRVYMEKVLKEPQPPLQIPEGKDEHPMLRGSRVHEAAEAYMKEDVDLIPELMQFAENFEVMRELQQCENVDFAIEEDWAYTVDWIPTGWTSEDAWLRMKVDCMIIRDEEAILIDYKTGRRHGNEISHMTQAQLYQLGAFIRFPELEHITVEFWYTDVGELTQADFKRDFGMQFKPLFTQKGLSITNEVRFDAKPAAYTCKYCPYGYETGNGVCKFAYSLNRKNKDA